MDSLGVVNQLGDGNFVGQLAEDLAAISAEVKRTGRPGKVTATFAILPDRLFGEPVVRIDTSTKRQPPASEPLGAMFYASEDGLFRDNPEQQPLTVREVDKTTGEVREATMPSAVVREAI